MINSFFAFVLATTVLATTAQAAENFDRTLTSDLSEKGSLNRAQVQAQKKTLLLSFLQNIIWQNEADFSEYHIAIVGADRPLLKALQKDTKRQQIKAKRIRVGRIDLDELQRVTSKQLVFVAQSAQAKLAEIVELAKNSNTLIVTENHPEKDRYMINFVTNQGGFEVQTNHDNLIASGFSWSNAVFEVKGREQDAAQLLRMTVDKLTVGADHHLRTA
jgi:hypothetical protein